MSLLGGAIPLFLVGYLDYLMITFAVLLPTFTK